MSPTEKIDAVLDALRTALLDIASGTVSNPNDELTIQEVAEVLRCSPSQVKTLCGMRGSDVKLPHHKRNNRVLVFRHDVDRYKTNEVSRTQVMRSPTRRRGN
jgi:hypothetical protein